MNIRKHLIFLAALFLLMVSGLSFVARKAMGADEKPGEAQVTVLLFSGMPDPICSITQDEVAQLEKLAVMLPTATGNEVPNDGLGYRGVILHTSSTQLRFFNGVVYRDGFSFEPRYLDTDRKLEKRILAYVRGCIGEQNWELLPAEVK